MDKLLLVDGMNLLFQMFYGMPARIVGRDGKAIQGTLGFIGAMLKMIRMTSSTHVAVLFDGEYTSQRTALDENYKGNRTDYSEIPEEETPFSQLRDIYRALDLLGICHAETSVCEADDWIAGYVRRYGEEMNIIIASQDSDFFQLITEKVQVLRYRGKQTTICDPGYIWQKLGILPGQYACFKSLTGDVADNIRGVEKIGPKTATQLLRQFEDLDTLLRDANQIRKPSIRAAIQGNAERIRRNHALIHLSGAKDLPFAMEELHFQDMGLTTTQVLVRIGIK